MLSRVFIGVGLALSATTVGGRTVILGDSMFAGGSSVKSHLEGMAGKGIEQYAVVGASAHDGYVSSVPAEYYNMDKNPIPTTIIMDGGANDALSVKGDCEAFNDNCRARLDEAVGIQAGLLNTMHNDGVAHIIYLGYHHLGGMDAAIDYGVNKLSGMCASAPLDCHFVDIRNAGIPVGDDNVHPTEAGYQIIAQRIWDVKLQNNIPI